MAGALVRTEVSHLQLPAHRNNLSHSEPALCSPLFWLIFWFGQGAGYWSDFVMLRSIPDSFFLFFFLFWVPQQLLSHLRWDTHLPRGHKMRMPPVQFHNGHYVLKEGPVWIAFKRLLKAIYSILGPQNWMSLWEKAKTQKTWALPLVYSVAFSKSFTFFTVYSEALHGNLNI